MCQKFAAIALVLAALAIAPLTAQAEMGPCTPDDRGGLTCGNGEGAARVIPKTRSPSSRLALAWRLKSSAPGYQLHEGNPDLESLIVRIEDGAILAKSHGSYWDLGTKIAKSYLITAWSPDSRLLVKVEQQAGFASAELFSFSQDDSAIGPIELVKIIAPAVLAHMDGVKGTGNYHLVFASHPVMTVDDQGLLHANVSARVRYSSGGPVYDVTAQITRAADSLDAKVVSVTPQTGASVSVIVH